MQEEEARQPEVADHAQLLVEPPRRLLAPPPAVALLEQRAAQLGQLAVGVRVLGAGVAIAEVLGQVEAEPLRKAAALLDGPGARGSARASARAAPACDERARRGSVSSSVPPSRTATIAS